MQLRADGLSGALQRPLAPVVWVHGDEPLLQIEACDAVRRAARSAGFEERQVFDAGRGFKVDALVGEARSLSLFAASRLIELRTSAKPTRELGEALAMLELPFTQDLHLFFDQRYGVAGFGMRHLQLLEHLMAEAGRQGGRECFLEVRASNQSAYRLYERFGFNEIGRRRDYYPAVGGREDALVMACPLFD